MTKRLERSGLVRERVRTGEIITKQGGERFYSREGKKQGEELNNANGRRMMRNAIQLPILLRILSSYKSDSSFGWIER
jgi:hypothetical protein